MIDPARSRRLVGQAAYVGIGLTILVVALLPLSPGRVGWPGPDLLVALTLAWVLRRPEQVPVAVIAALALTADVLLMRPIGLGAAIMVAGSEAARLREHRWRAQGFLVEWLRVGVLMGAMVLADRVLRTILAVPQTLAPMPPLGQDLLRLIATVAAYPLVVWVARTLAGLRRAAPGETEPG